MLISLQVIDGFDLENEVWSFFSRFGRKVDIDRFSEKIKLNCLEHIQMSIDTLKDEDYVHKFYAKVETDLCNCEVIMYNL